MATGFDQDDFLGKGWSFPPTFIPALNGVEMTEKVEDIQRSLQILLTTRVGERIMQPKYGCNMDEMVFESLSTTTKTLIKDKIKTAILYFEPRIDVTDIAMNTTNELEGEINDFVSYFEQHPGSTTTNPFFGELNFEEWIQLLHKHAVHHLKQFNCL